MAAMDSKDIDTGAVGRGQQSMAGSACKTEVPDKCSERAVHNESASKTARPRPMPKQVMRSCMNCNIPMQVRIKFADENDRPTRHNRVTITGEFMNCLRGTEAVACIDRDAGEVLEGAA